MGTIGEEYESGLVMGEQSTHGGKDTHVPRHVEAVTGPVVSAAAKGNLMRIYAINLRPFRPSHLPIWALCAL